MTAPALCREAPPLTVPDAAKTSPSRVAIGNLTFSLIKALAVAKSSTISRSPIKCETASCHSLSMLIKSIAQPTMPFAFVLILVSILRVRHLSSAKYVARPALFALRKSMPSCASSSLFTRSQYCLPPKKASIASATSGDEHTNTSAAALGFELIKFFSAAFNMALTGSGYTPVKISVLLKLLY